MIWFNILNIFAQKWHTIIALIYTVKQNEHILSCQWSTLNWNWIEIEGHCSVWISGFKWPELIITSKWAHVLISCFTGSHIRGTFFHTPPPAHPPRISLSLPPSLQEVVFTLLLLFLLDGQTPNSLDRGVFVKVELSACVIHVWHLLQTLRSLSTARNEGNLDIARDELQLLTILGWQ